MNEYPDVWDEMATMDAVVTGRKNLARFGDGEIKMSEGEGYRRQQGSPRLADDLSEVLRKPHRNCLVGIPTMDPKGPKFANWDRHRARILKNLSPKVTYYSAFVTRPDSAPWIETRQYGQLVASIWSGRRAVVVCERKGSMFRAVRIAARSAVHVECPHSGAYDVIDELHGKALSFDPDVVVLSVGPSATILANRFAREGVWAVDLGSAGQMLCRLQS